MTPTILTLWGYLPLVNTPKNFPCAGTELGEGTEPVTSTWGGAFGTTVPLAPPYEDVT